MSWIEKRFDRLVESKKYKTSDKRTQATVIGRFEKDMKRLFAVDRFYYEPDNKSLNVKISKTIDLKNARLQKSLEPLKTKYYVAETNSSLKIYESPRSQNPIFRVSNWDIEPKVSFIDWNMDYMKHDYSLQKFADTLVQEAGLPNPTVARKRLKEAEYGRFPIIAKSYRGLVRGVDRLTQINVQENLGNIYINFKESPRRIARRTKSAVKTTYQRSKKVAAPTKRVARKVYTQSKRLEKPTKRVLSATYRGSKYVASELYKNTRWGRRADIRKSLSAVPGYIMPQTMTYTQPTTTTTGAQTTCVPGFYASYESIRGSIAWKQGEVVNAYAKKGKKGGAKTYEGYISASRWVDGARFDDLFAAAKGNSNLEKLAADLMQTYNSSWSTILNKIY